MLLRIYCILFGIVHITLCFLATSKGHSISSESSTNTVGFEMKPSNLMHYVNALSLYSSFATHVIIHIENLLFGQQEDAICEKWKIINDIFVSKLNHAPDYKARRTKYIQTIGIFMGCLVMSFTTAFSALPEMYHDLFFMSPSMLIGVIILRARWYQIALYLNMIADTLEDLHILLKQHQIQSFEESYEGGIQFVPEKIRYIREIYTNVWVIATLISDAFGWSLIIFLVKVRQLL